MSTASSDAGVESLLVGFPRERHWLLPALHAVQHALGWLPASALADVSAHLRVPASEVYGVATHYPEFRLVPRGQHHVRICTGVPCALRGGRELLDSVVARWNVVPDAMGAERELTLEAADCFFACGVAPLVEVDGALHGRVTPADVARLPEWFIERRKDGEGRASPARTRRQLLTGPTEDAASSASPDAVHQSAPEALAALVAAARRRARGRPPLRILVQSGTCGRALGADALLAALRAGVRARGLEAEIIDGACSGMCYAAPVVEVVAPGGPPFLIERLAASSAPGLLDLTASGQGDFAQGGLSGVVRADNAWRGLAPIRDHPFWATQERRLLARSGALDPESLDDALVGGSYTALARALAGRPKDVIETIRASGVQGRGGAFFPTGLKWEACRKATGEPKYVVMNGEEGEPGIFKDRHLMEGDPHLVLEGVLLAAYAAGATRAILYIHGQADLSAARMARAVAEARSAGLVGQRILASLFACEVEIRRGAGGFVLGEETALLESIEGRRAQPRTRPPFPVECGLFGKPTVINNVETLATIPSILSHPEVFAGLGTANAPGTKVFGLAGPLARPGVVEVRNGVTLRHLLEIIAGGSADGGDLVGALVGGPSGSIVPAALFDVPMAPRGEVSPGTGGIAAVPAGASIVEIVKTLVGFNARESCGKCTPCREGLPRLLAGIERLGIEPDAESRARALAETIQLASLCGLGQAAPLAFVRALETFGAELGRR